MKKNFAALAALAFLSCLNTDDVAENCGGKDLQQLRTQDAITEPCKEALQNVLPAPENNLYSVVALGSGAFNQKTVLFLTGTDSSGQTLSVTRRSFLKITASTAAADSLLDTTRYSVGKLKDYSGTNVSISSVLDYSASMSDQDILDASQTYSGLFDVLAASTAPFESNVFFFSDSVVKVGDFSSRADTLKNRVRANLAFKRSSTALFDGMAAGLKSLAGRPAPIKLLIVSTDGLENSSKTYKTADTLYALAKASKTRVVVLGALLADLGFMRSMAAQTGGLYVYSKSVVALKTDFLNVESMLANVTAVQLNSLPAGTKTITVQYGKKTASFSL